MSNDIAIQSLKEKIDDLNQQAWEIRVTDSPKAFQLSEESVKLARSINYPKGLAEGLRSLGFAYVRLFKNEEAAPLLKEALSLFQSLNDLKGQAIAYEYLGIIERNWGNLGASLELLLKGYALIQQVGSIEIEVTSCYHIGVTYKHLGNHENALDYLYKSLSIAKSSGNVLREAVLMEAYATNIIGSIYFDNGDYKHALDCYQRGLVIRRESHDKWGEAGSLDNIGFTYLKLNDLDKAIDYCKQSLAISQNTDDKKGEANALLHLAEIYEQAGDIIQASKFSNESLVIRKTRGDKRGEAEVLLFLANLHKNRDDIEDRQILEWLSDALKIAEEIKAQDILSKACFNLHEYHTQKGNYKESLVQLEAHLQIEKELHKNAINQKITNLEISHKAETISRRNKELIELNAKIEKANEELKIEASLERVRAVAMSMKKPDDLLSICKILFTELEVLGIKELRNAMINIYNDEKNTFLNYDFSGSLGQSITVFSMIHSHPVPDYITKQIRQGKSHFAEIALTDAQLADWTEFREKNGELPDPKLKNASTLYYYFYSVGTAAIGISTLNSITKEEHEILMRFRNVFDLAYKRYTDIKQAEAQAREAQIEAALERVRATSMAMHHSNDLVSVINIIQEQLLGLGFHFHGANFATDYNEHGYTMWLASPGESFPYKIYVPQIGQNFFEAVKAAIEKGLDFATYTLSFEEKNIYFKNLFENSLAKNTSEEGKRMAYESKGMAASVVLLDKVRLNLMNLDLIPYTDEENNILRRFGYVFEQSYTRFLDLQKAEAQAKEAQIEAALERVRSRSMAMHKSDELREVVAVLFAQLQHIGFDIKFCTIALIDKVNSTVEFWLSGFSQEILPESYHVPNLDHPFYQNFQNTFRQGIPYKVFELAGEEKRSYDKLWFTLTDFKNLPEPVKKPMMEMKRVVLSCAFTKNGMIQIGGFEPLSDTDASIAQRFAKVFEQTHTRFLDLQKAEAQAREAQIETGLERVRSKTMAMHKSEEVTGVAVSLCEELLKLGFEGGSTIIIMDKETGDMEQWTGFSEDKSLKSCYVPYFKHPCHDAQLNAWKKGEKFLVYTLAGDEKRFLDEHYFTTGYKGFPESDKRWMRQMESVTFSHAFMKYGAIHWGPDHITEEQLRILQRFSKVFEQSYTRFLDLQKAEAQAREAKIEAALEKIRASTMAMQQSEDLSQTAFVLFNQFKELGEAPERIFIATFDDHDNGVVDLWGTDQGGNQLNKLFKLPVNEPTMVSKIIAAWKEKKRSVVIDLKGEDLKAYLRSLKQAGIPVTEGIMTDRRVQTAACFSSGVIGVTTSEPQSAEAVQLQERFAGVFDLTYTRFLDLQKAEAQAREAKIETALERVRARALAMQEPEELKDVAQVLRTEMGLLGVEELETCSIYINDESAEKAECWYALKDTKSEEKKLVNDHFALNLNDTWVGREMLQFYRSPKKQISIVMQGENRKEWIHYCEENSAPLRGYYGEVIPDRTYHLYKFSHGAIGAAAAGDISEESWRMLRRAASVFSLAYSRFKDLTQARTDLIKLKEEKKRAEEALTELQATQKQLIQSEKMASLGELTAGIAHEIQNPLNFVNNFSDVSNELLEEMKTELEKGNAEEAKAIAVNVKENLEKILHHGKRADAIVKGMLQHSRSSSGQKELTDINTLAEEYLRLAYHGLRAKDKFFNAKFETDLDPSINKINVVPQEIGRVILNLINNSFYAVSEKKRSVSNGYEPSVTVSTKKINNKIEIRVKDNGNGIPQKDLDKIFQPFFTTKPTGQGTGLGLSLSYDIVTKGHDGEIKVETKEGEGSAFIISLPMK